MQCYFDAEKLPSEVREQTRDKRRVRLTIASRQVLPREFRSSSYGFSMFNGEDGEESFSVGGYGGELDEAAMSSPLIDTLPPNPSPFVEDDDAVAEAIQQALDAVEGLDREDPAFEEAMREAFPVLSKAIFSGGDAYTHRASFTTEAWLEEDAGEWVLTYPEPEDNGLGRTITMVCLPCEHAADADERIIRIQRNGEMTNVLVLIEGRRIVNAYPLGEADRPLELCAFARRLDWNIDAEQGGTIFMDYIVEIRGADVQRSTLRMDIKPMK